MTKKNEEEDLQGLWPFKGLAYFIAHPNLWILPILGSIFLFAALVAIFILIMFFSWPHGSLGWLRYTLEIARGFGYSLCGVLIAFIILLPFLIALALDRMVRKVIRIEGITTRGESFLVSFYSTTYMMFKTIGWRIFWPLIGILSAIFLGPIGAFIASIGIGHLAAIDGCDLSLSILGVKAKERMALYHHRRWQLFWGGVIGGLMSLVLSITFIGWILWIPAMFVGAALWVLSWPGIKNNTTDF